MRRRKFGRRRVRGRRSFKKRGRSRRKFGARPAMRPNRIGIRM